MRLTKNVARISINSRVIRKIVAARAKVGRFLLTTYNPL